MKNFITDNIKKESVNALEKMISCPSYNEEARRGAPFGKKVRKALDQMLDICGDLGFRTYVDPDGYYGYAEVGTGDKVFGIIGHVDTVPAGEVKDWDTDPYKAEVKDNVIYGRGSQDDKGPTIAALYAVKALMDSGVVFNQRIRFIFGTDEEILWRGIAEYNKKEDGIDSGIAPDAEFPLIYAEKGLQQSYIVGPGTDELKVDVDNAFNAVPAAAKYDGEKLAEVKSALDELGFDYTDKGDSIVVNGKAVHAMLAPQGTNAILRLGEALNTVFNFKPLQLFGDLKEDATGDNLIGSYEDESGHLTMNIASLSISPKETRMKLDIRIPVTVDRDEVIDNLNDKLKKYDLHHENFDYVKALYVPKDSKLVQTLMSVYKDKTGDEKAEPIVSGGATFARTMHNCVAFGAMFPDTPDYMHQVNEQWRLSDMFKAMDIYAEAIYRLCV